MNDQAEPASTTGRQHNEEEWERIRIPFTHLYVEKNLSLKEASRRIRDEYGFIATARQYERRIGPDKWNLPKYANRDDRLRAMEANGITLESLSNRGRRRSTGSSADGTLQIDRNTRRWARRELSRDSNRPRARSTSGLSDVSDTDMSSRAPSPTPSFYDATPLSQPLFNDVWLSPDRPPPAQPFHGALSNVDVPPVPQIIFTTPDEQGHYLPELKAQTSESASMGQHHAYAAGHELGEPLAGLQSDFSLPEYTADPDSAMQQTYTWPTNIQTIASDDDYASALIKDDDQSSFVDMLSNESAPDVWTRMPDDNLGQAFKTEISELPQGDQLPVLDNTYDDVYALVQAHHSQMNEMIVACLQTCTRYGASQQSLQSIRLLQGAVAAQGMELDRTLRNTLANISATNKQATRSIFDLSLKRKKRVDELNGQLKALQPQPSI